jgi:hypothetical protein
VLQRKDQAADEKVAIPLASVSSTSPYPAADATLSRSTLTNLVKRTTALLQPELRRHKNA